MDRVAVDDSFVWSLQSHMDPPERLPFSLGTGEIIIHLYDLIVIMEVRVGQLSLFAL